MTLVVLLAMSIQLLDRLRVNHGNVFNTPMASDSSDKHLDNVSIGYLRDGVPDVADAPNELAKDFLLRLKKKVGKGRSCRDEHMCLGSFHGISRIATPTSRSSPSVGSSCRSWLVLQGLWGGNWP